MISLSKTELLSTELKVVPSKGKKKKKRQAKAKYGSKCISCGIESHKKFLYLRERGDCDYVLICFQCLPEADGSKKGVNIQKQRNKKKIKEYRRKDGNKCKFVSKWKEKYNSSKEYKDFYKKEEWKILRTKVLNHYGKQCMCCKTKKGIMHVDHIKPRFAFPELELEFDNMQVLCECCNIGKGHFTDTDWRKSLLCLKIDIK